jgi:hypothetical protein
LLAFLTREPSTNHQSQAGFLTCASPKEPFPSKKNSGTTPFGLLNYIRTDAYSGATATDFHRVPFLLIRPARPDLQSDIFFSKEQTQNTRAEK